MMHCFIPLCFGFYGISADGSGPISLEVNVLGTVMIPKSEWDISKVIRPPYWPNTCVKPFRKQTMYIYCIYRYVSWYVVLSAWKSLIWCCSCNFGELFDSTKGKPRETPIFPGSRGLGVKMNFPVLEIGFQIDVIVFLGPSIWNMLIGSMGLVLFTYIVTFTIKINHSWLM